MFNRRFNRRGEKRHELGDARHICDVIENSDGEIQVYRWNSGEAKGHSKFFPVSVREKILKNFGLV